MYHPWFIRQDLHGTFPVQRQTRRAIARPFGSPPFAPQASGRRWSFISSVECNQLARFTAANPLSALNGDLLTSGEVGVSSLPFIVPEPTNPRVARAVAVRVQLRQVTFPQPGFLGAAIPPCAAGELATV